MKAFFRLVLCATFMSVASVSGQDKPVSTVKSIVEDFTKLRVEVTEAKVSQQAMDEVSILLSGEKIQTFILESMRITTDPKTSESDRRVINDLDIESLVNDFGVISIRSEVSKALSKWELKDFNDSLNRSRTVLDQLISNGFLFPYQPQQVNRVYFDLQVLSEVVKNNDFWIKVCDGDDTCLKAVPALSDDIAARLDQAKRMVEKAKNWNPQVEKKSIVRKE